MTIFIVPDGRDAWNFHGAADVDGRRYVRGRVNRESAVVIEDLPGGGLRYRGLGADVRPISGSSDAPDDHRGGRVLGEDMAPHSPPTFVAARQRRAAPRSQLYSVKPRVTAATRARISSSDARASRPRSTTRSPCTHTSVTACGDIA